MRWKYYSIIFLIIYMYTIEWYSQRFHQLNTLQGPYDPNKTRETRHSEQLLSAGTELHVVCSDSRNLQMG